MPVYCVFQFAIIWRVIADACAAHDALGLGGSDPLHYIWAAKPHKTGGRYRPNRDFRSRSFFSIEVRKVFPGEALEWLVGERSAYL